MAGMAWRSLLLSLLGLVLATFFLFLHLDRGQMPAAVAQVLVGLLATVSWALVVWFLMLDTWGRRLWLVVMAGALALVVLQGETGMGFAIALSAIMLVLRRYRTWRLISDRRRAVGFGLGLVAILLLVVAQRLWSIEGQTAVGQLGRNLGTWSVWSLGVFWAFSLFHLALNMRLHFLRLRPKLAVSAFLIGVLPLLLLVGLGLIATYSMLGGARAARLDNTLNNWQDMAHQGADLSGALFDTTFVWPAAEPVGTKSGAWIPAPAWVAGMSDGMRQMVANKARLQHGSGSTDGAVIADSTTYFLADGNIWLMRWRGLDTKQPQVQAWLLGHRPLRTLSKILKASLDVRGTGIIVNNGEFIFGAAADDSTLGGFRGFSASYRDSVGAGDTAWNEKLLFGGTIREVIVLRKSTIEKAEVLIQLRVDWQDLSDEFRLGNGSLNQVVVIFLGLAVFLWLVIEIFAVFFGVRISEGIVGGVHALHRGTRAVAAGDLETVIEIPNQDEFGDLAASFNEMTLAVRHGREIALANDRLRQELATARSIQLRLLPSDDPRLGDFEVTGASIPSREVGGDYYDFLLKGEGKLGIAIGDVSGKGMPAALLMSNLQASLHGQVLHPGSVSGVVARVNDLLVRSTDPHMFATFFYGELDSTASTFTCTNAGHNPPLLLRRDGAIEELATGGLLLGMLGDQPYKQESVELAPGEVIVLYTDGITEAVGPSAEEDDPEAMFGEDALYEVMRSNRHLPAVGIKDAILAAVTAHTSGVAQSDDITLVVIRRQG